MAIAGILGIPGHQTRAAELGRLKVSTCCCYAQALNGIAKALNGKEQLNDASELMRCTHCWDWVPESSCSLALFEGGVP